MNEILQFFQNPFSCVAAPEIIVLIMAVITLLVSLFVKEQRIYFVYALVQLTLGLSAYFSIAQIGNSSTSSLAFNGLYMADDIGNWLKIFIDISAFGSFYYAKNYVQENNMPSSEYYLLGLLSVLGMLVLCSAHSLLMIYLGLETLSLPIYAMIALRRDVENALEASIKYFVMGAIASGMLLYGMSMLYGTTGSLDFSIIAQKTATASSLMASFGLVFLIAGIGFKLAAVPFHMWAPDVYTGSPTSVTLFLSTAPKIAGFAMAIRLLIFAVPGMLTQWQPILIILTILSTAVSAFLAIAQTNIKRLLAYSTIGHMGYALFGLISGTPAGYAASLFYILIYSLMSLAAFALITLMSRQGIEIQNIDDFKGLNSRNPWLAFLMLLLLLSLAGVPPLAGFFTKLLVLKALVDVGFIKLAIFGLIMAVISAFYYIRIIKVMYFDNAPAEFKKIILTKGEHAFFSINTLSLLFLGIFPNALIQACLSAFGG